jgi:hypothetical protein
MPVATDLSPGETCGLGPRLNSAEQNQDQQNDDDKAQSAAAVIPGAVERAAAKAAEAAKQNDDQNDYKNCADRHEMISDFYVGSFKTSLASWRSFLFADINVKTAPAE